MGDFWYDGGMKSLNGKKILVGVTGGIAAYKTCSLVNEFIKEGAEVRVMMTEAATKFVTPLTFQALTNRPVYSDMWKPIDENSVEHISLSHWPDVIVITPVTANTIAKIANGFADNTLTTAVLAAKPETKIVVAPAMNTFMWLNSATQRNVSILKKDGMTIVDPREGILACRDEGAGKVADNKTIIDAVKNSFSPKK